MTVETGAAGRGRLDGETVTVLSPEGAGGIVLACEHASRFIPPEYEDLGLSGEALTSHIAWDPGALGVARAMASILNAPLVAQNVSRLVYDCNRPPEAPSATPARSERFDIPGNAGLTDEERQRRAARYYVPFCDALARALDAPRRAGPPALVTVHTFTPVFNGVRRDVELGILHDKDARLADTLLAALAGRTKRDVRRNEPYGPADGVTHSLALHALPRGLPNVMIEIRSDLVASEADERAMAELLAHAIVAALDRVPATGPKLALPAV